jgi:hypothetical protein
MKSITIKGSESVGKVTTTLHNAGGFLACYTGDQPVHFSEKAFKSLVYTNAHTVVIDLEKENHLMLF